MKLTAKPSSMFAIFDLPREKRNRFSFRIDGTEIWEEIYCQVKGRPNKKFEFDLLLEHYK